MGIREYRRGLTDLGNGGYAWLQPDESWGDAERIAVNVSVLYKEFAGDRSPNGTAALFALMAQLHRERRR